MLGPVLGDYQIHKTTPKLIIAFRVICQDELSLIIQWPRSIPFDNFMARLLGPSPAHGNKSQSTIKPGSDQAQLKLVQAQTLYLPVIIFRRPSFNPTGPTVEPGPQHSKIHVFFRNNYVGQNLATIPKPKPACSTIRYKLAAGPNNRPKNTGKIQRNVSRVPARPRPVSIHASNYS